MALLRLLLLFSLIALGLALGVEWLRALEAQRYEFLPVSQVWAWASASSYSAARGAVPAWLWSPYILWFLNVPVWVYPLASVWFLRRRIRARQRRRWMFRRV